MKVLFSNYFLRKYKKLKPNMVSRVDRRLEIFKLNPFDQKLKTHKLKGELKGIYSFYVSYKIRILFEFWNDGIRLLDIDDHDHVY